MDRTLFIYPTRLGLAIVCLAIMSLAFGSDRSVIAADEAGETNSPVDENGHIVDFQRDVAPILVRRCLNCHGPEDAKNDFRVDDQETIMQYIEPEDLESSSLYTDYLITESEDELMPPPSKGGPLTAAELALIRVWIEDGAPWVENVVVAPGSDGVADPAPKADAPARSFADRLWAFQGFLHPATVHFPIRVTVVRSIFCRPWLEVAKVGNSDSSRLFVYWGHPRRSLRLLWAGRSRPSRVTPVGRQSISIARFSGTVGVASSLPLSPPSWPSSPWCRCVVRVND